MKFIAPIMIKSITVFICLLPIICFGQGRCFPYPEGSEVKLYGNSNSEFAECSITQGHNGYQWYDFEVLDETPLRYKVRIISLPDTPMGEDVTDNVDGEIYWVNKNDCAVFSSSTDCDCNGNYFYLYEKPGSEERIKIYENQVVEKIFRPLTYDNVNQDWLNVSVKTSKGILSGWVKRWCQSIYNSCN